MLNDRKWKMLLVIWNYLYVYSETAGLPHYYLKYWYKHINEVQWVN